MTLEALTALNAQNITQSDTTVYDPPLKFLAVFAVDGTITIRNEKDEAVVFTIPTAAAGAGVPFLIPGRIRRVMNTGTTIANAALIGIR
jgi:hypothetical protein